MSYDPDSGKVDWRDEAGWMLISLVSAIVLTLLFIYFGTFSDPNVLILFLVTCAAFHLISILVRIQNYRGVLLTGRTAFPEKWLKVVFPVLGFAVGLAMILVS